MKKFLWLPLLATLLLAGCTVGGGSTGDSGAEAEGEHGGITSPEGGGSLPEGGGSTGGNGDGGFTNPGDQLGGGGVVEAVPDVTESDSMEDASTAAGETEKGEAAPDSAQEISAKTTIQTAGDYVVTGTFEGKISVEVTDGTEAEGVHLFLKNASITNEKKVIESNVPLTVTLIGENTLTSTTADGANTLTCDSDLTINGEGSLTVVSTKNAVKANTISVAEATLNIQASGDGLHAEIDAYDDLTEAPVPTFDDGGWVVLDGAKITINSTDDGIQADTFVLVRGDTVLDITTNGGAPARVTEQSSDAADGKGIKAGAIDWGADKTEIVSDLYLIGVEGGEITINANDDAIHSDGEIEISGGTLTIATGDDGVHAENLLTVTGGSISVSKCYEGLEAAKVEISGGDIDVVSVDDAINAADGTTLPMNQANPNCHIIISGGNITVDASGDGVDSNGSILMTGGTVVVFGPTDNGNAALDADGGILVDGGYLFAVGSMGMVETPAQNSKQNVLSYAQNQTLAANSVLTLTKDDGTALWSITVKKNCQSVIVSCPELVTGENFKLYGGETELCAFTVSSTITTVGSQGNMGPGGQGGPGGMGGPSFGGAHGGRW